MVELRTRTFAVEDQGGKVIQVEVFQSCDESKIAEWRANLQGPMVLRTEDGGHVDRISQGEYRWNGVVLRSDSPDAP